MVDPHGDSVFGSVLVGLVDKILTLVEEHHQLLVVKALLLQRGTLKDTLSDTLEFAFEAQERAFQVAVLRYHINDVGLQGAATHALSDQADRPTKLVQAMGFPCLLGKEVFEAKQFEEDTELLVVDTLDPQIVRLEVEYLVEDIL